MLAVLLANEVLLLDTLLSARTLVELAEELENLEALAAREAAGAGAEAFLDAFPARLAGVATGAVWLANLVALAWAAVMF